MKFFYFAILFFASGFLISSAQTNVGTNAVDEILALMTTNSPAETKPPRGPTLIQADGPADFDLTAHTVIYRDNVRVDDPQMKLRCEWLFANLPQGDEHITNIVARTNVVIDFTDDKGQTNRATGDQAVYFFHAENGVTNETVTLTGNPEIENAQGKSTGDVIVWDRAKNHLTITNPKMVIQQNFTGAVETNLAVTNNLSPPK